jgi:ABC-2 type transport system permease protein
MGAIYRRELKSYFTSPIGFSILIIFYFFSGIFFGATFGSGNPDLSGIFSTMFYIIMVLIPILTMRSFSEDKRQKTDQLLLTAPIKLPAIVMGKFLASLSVFGMAMGIMVVYQVIVSFYITPDWLVFFGNLLGMLLFGAALISVGLFVSTLTESQMVAAISCFAIELVIVLMDVVASMLPSTSVFYRILNWLSIYDRYTSFTKGTLDYANVIFFLSIAFVFIMLTTMVNDRRRYA